MRRITVLAALVLGVVLLAAACTPAASPTAEPTATPGATEEPTPSVLVPTSLITAGKVVDCVDIEYPPMEYFPSADVTDPAQAIGFDVDSARAVVNRWGLQIEIRNTAFDALVPDLQAGRCDIMWTALFVNATRLEVLDAVPYLATGHVVMVVKDNPKGIATLNDLCGKSVSIQSGGLVEEKINEQNSACAAAGLPAIDIQGYPTVVEELQQIVTGRVDAVWETDTAVADWMVKNPGQYEIAFVVSRDDAYGVYFQKNKPDLAAALVDAFKALKADGSWATIATQYAQDPEALAPACPHDTATMGCHQVE